MKRLDVYLFENNFFPTREKAKEAILQGNIMVGNKVCIKPSFSVDENSIINISSNTLKYVSRAGLKIERAKEFWNIDFNNKIVLDVGASTGGFTDFAIQNGAKKVYAVDVGVNQLHKRLKENNNVINLEKTDFRNLELKEDIDITVCDCSFISLKLFISKFKEIVKNGKILITLIKPQFECGKQIATKYKGVIKDRKIQEEIKNKIVNEFEKNDFKNIGVIDSPILGTKGNKEFLAYFIKK